MYGFVPDIDEANSPPFSTVAMLKSVTCACPKQNINLYNIIYRTFIYLIVSVFVIYKHHKRKTFDSNLLNYHHRSFIQFHFFLLFFFYACTIMNTNSINRQLVIVMYHMYNVTQTMSHA